MAMEWKGSMISKEFAQRCKVQVSHFWLWPTMPKPWNFYILYKRNVKRVKQVSPLVDISWTFCCFCLFCSKAKLIFASIVKLNKEKNRYRKTHNNFIWLKCYLMKFGVTTNYILFTVQSILFETFKSAFIVGCSSHQTRGFIETTQFDRGKQNQKRIWNLKL